MRQPLSQRFGTSETIHSMNDLYETPAEATLELLKVEDLVPVIWEPACGLGSISKVFEKKDFVVISTDLYNYGYGKPGIDFLKEQNNPLPNTLIDIVTNPPYSLMLEFCEQAVKLMTSKVCMFLRLDFLASKGRRHFLESSPLARVHIFSGRIRVKTPTIEKGRAGVNYAWFVWEKGYKGKPQIDWVY